MERASQLATVPGATSSITASLRLGVAVDHIQEERGAVLGARAAERLVEGKILTVHPWRLCLSPPEQAAPTDPSLALIERQAQADGVQIRPRVGPVESVPGAIRPKICLLGHVLRLLAIAEDRRQSADQPGIVLRHSRSEGVLATRGAEIQLGDPLHLTLFNSRARPICAATLGPPAAGRSQSASVAAPANEIHVGPRSSVH